MTIDEIVAAVQHHDDIYVFCRSGKIYKMSFNLDGHIIFTLMMELFRP